MKIKGAYVLSEPTVLFQGAEFRYKLPSAEDVESLKESVKPPMQSITDIDGVKTFDVSDDLKEEYRVNVMVAIILFCIENTEDFGFDGDFDKNKLTYDSVNAIRKELLKGLSWSEFQKVILLAEALTEHSPLLFESQPFLSMTGQSGLKRTF